MVIISSREFRQHQAEYFERVDKGEQIIVQRGKNKAYKLLPINENDMYLNTEMVEKLKKSISEIENGQLKRISSAAEIKELLGL
jgi:prevent-host-death family protein